MKGIKVKKVTREVEVTLTDEDWQLYTSSMDCRDAAHELNTALKQALSAPGATRSSVEKAVGKVMDKWAKWGAADSEPIHVLYGVLDSVFGEED